MKRLLPAFALLLTSGYTLADECADATTQADLNTCSAAQSASRSVIHADWAFFNKSRCAGSAQPMVNSQCLTDKTNEREAFLSSLLQCEEGDLSCPLPPAS